MPVFTRLAKEPAVTAGCVFTFGTFDGVHLGHKHIFDVQSRIAKEYKAESALLTFSNHPRELLFPKEPTSWLTSDRQKLRLLASYGFKAIIDIPFDAAFKELSAAAFLEKIRAMVPFSHLVVGDDVAFGKGRVGNKSYLESQAIGFSTNFVEKFCVEGLPVSSSRIRQSIAQGSFKEAEKLLGRPYAVELRRTSETDWDPLGFTLPPKGTYLAAVCYNGEEIFHDCKVEVSSIIQIYDKNEISHSAELQFIEKIL